jgi:sulfite reductase alpha subunit-like flavoprotein
VEQLLSALPALQPRSYSCTNTPLSHPRELHFAFNVADYVDAYGRRRLGVCTPWLDRISRPLQKGSVPQLYLPVLRVYLRPNNTHFRVPESHLERPMILIGPGTGVAPFVVLGVCRLKLSGHNLDRFIYSMVVVMTD